MNMGVADGVDLGWKIAAVVQGWGGSKLLDSYERERRPVHEFVINEAVVNHSVLGNELYRDGLEDDDEHGQRARRELQTRIEAVKIREFTTLGVVLGYRYDDSPVIVGDGTPPSSRDFLNYVPSARPVCLAPHVWLHDGTSLYDHFGQGFTLIVTDDSDTAEIERVREAARMAGVPLEVLRPREPAIADLYRARYALIRPDQHIAWRGNAWPDNVTNLLLLVTGRLRRMQPEA